MATRPESSTAAFLSRLDALDAEANAVTHAVVRAQATVKEIVNDTRRLLSAPVADESAWADLSVQLMCHRSTLLDALDLLSRSDRPSTAGLSPMFAPSESVTASSTPCPPRTVAAVRLDPWAAARAEAVERAYCAREAPVTVHPVKATDLIPAPPVPRLRPIPEAQQPARGMAGNPLTDPGGSAAPKGAVVQ